MKIKILRQITKQLMMMRIMLFQSVGLIAVVTLAISRLRATKSALTTRYTPFQAENRRDRDVRCSNDN